MQDDTLTALSDVCTRLERVASRIRQETDQIVSSQDHIALIRHFKQLRDVNKQIKDAREALSDIEDATSHKYIPDLLHDLKQRTGLKTPINIEGIGRVTVSYRFSCSILDKEAGFKWLREKGHGDLIQETVNSGTLSSFAKEQVEVQGVDLPDDIFKTGSQAYTSITKG